MLAVLAEGVFVVAPPEHAWLDGDSLSSCWRLASCLHRQQRACKSIPRLNNGIELLLCACEHRLGIDHRRLWIWRRLQNYKDVVQGLDQNIVFQKNGSWKIELILIASTLDCLWTPHFIPLVRFGLGSWYLCKKNWQEMVIWEMLIQQ